MKHGDTPKHKIVITNISTKIIYTTVMVMPNFNAQRQEDELYSCVNHSTCMVASLVIDMAIGRWVFYL